MEVALFNSHVLMNLPVEQGGFVLECNIYQHNPLELEAMNPALCFLTSVHGKKREAVNGRWKRLPQSKPISLGNVEVGVIQSYDFIWLKGIQPRPRFRMTEYMSTKQARRAISFIIRRLDQQGQGQQEQQEHEGQGQAQQEQGGQGQAQLEQQEHGQGQAQLEQQEQGQVQQGQGQA